MNCKLCDNDIKNYDPRFHHLKIDDSHDTDICQECIDKLIKWQSKIFAELFPTKTLKKRYQDK